jgi:hypothetical protein
MTRDGRSLLPLLGGGEAPADWRDALLLEIGYSRAVVTRDGKYIANRAPESVLTAMRKEAGTAARKTRDASTGWNGQKRGHHGAELDFPAYFDADQLYDLASDPFERKNLAGDPAHAAAAISVAAMSLLQVSASTRVPGLILPGQRINAGTRAPS